MLNLYLSIHVLERYISFTIIMVKISVLRGCIFKFIYNIIYLKYWDGLPMFIFHPLQVWTYILVVAALKNTRTIVKHHSLQTKLVFGHSCCFHDGRRHTMCQKC